MEKKSVLFIHHGTIIGGAPVSLSLQVKGIIQRGNLRCKIACNSEEMRKFFSDEGIETIPWPYPCTNFGKVLIRWSRVNNLTATIIFIKELIRLPFSIIHQIFLFSKCEEKIIHLNSAVLFSTACAAKITGKKIVWHIREASFFPKIVALFIYHLADSIICISPIEASRFIDTNKKINVIYNPVDFDKFDCKKYDREKIRETLGIPDHANVVINLGGVNFRKGTTDIIHGLKKCAENYFAIIVGPALQSTSDDEYQKEVMELCKGEIGSRVIFTGIVENPAPYVAASDLLIFIGKTPHFPRPVFEAWAMKKPVIVNEMEGISNNIDKEINGIIINEPLEDTLAKSLARIFSDRNHLRQMGEAGNNKAIEYMSPEKSAKKMEDLFQEIHHT
jgi:glycosyltransferase involved in cell wall biosynthesis